MKEKLTHKYLEIDEPLRNYFTKRYAEYLIFLFSGITFLLVMHMFAFLPVFLIIMLIFIGGLSYNCVKCLDGDILKISGAVDEIYIPRARKKKAFDRDYLMLRTTDQKFIDYSGAL